MAERKRSGSRRTGKSSTRKNGKSNHEGHDDKPCKRLYRSKNDIIMGGVCGGMAEYMEVDPTAVRLIWILITLVTGLFPAIIVYLIAWIIIPQRP